MTSRNVFKSERGMVFRPLSAGWSFIASTHHPVCFGSCLILSLQADFYPVGAFQIPNFRLYIPVQVPGTSFFDTKSFTGINKSWLGMRKILLHP